MAVSQDEWNGELTKFLDKLPVRPCIVPPPPSFCTVCGRLDTPVATACKFYPLRFEREMGRTTVEPAAFKPRHDTFEIDIGFEEEEEEPELPEAPMIEFEPPERPPASAPSAVGRKGSAEEAEVEVVEAELVEVIDEEEEEEQKEGGREGQAGKGPERLKDEVQRTIEDEIEEELKAEVKASEILRKTERESQELEEAEQEKPLKREKELEVRLKERPLATPAKKEDEKTIETKIPQEESEKKEIGVSEEIEPEAAPPLKKIAKAVRIPEEETEETASAIAIKQPEGEHAMDAKPQTLERITVIAPIYPQPKLKIIDAEKPISKDEELPLPPPPPDYRGIVPISSSPTQETRPEAPKLPQAPIEPIAPIPEIEKPKEEKGHPLPQIGLDEPQKASSQSPREPEKRPAPATSPPSGRRTGGLYDIFRRKPAESKKEVIRPDKGDGDDMKKQSDEELLTRLKNLNKD